MNDTQQESRTLILVIFSMIHFFNHFYLLMVPSILPAIKFEFNLSYTLSGLVVTGLNLSYALFALPAGIAADRMNRKILIAMNIIWFSAVMFLTGFSVEYWHLLALQVLAGVGGGLYHPSGLAMISDLFVKNRGRAMGVHGSLGFLSGFAGPLLSGIIGTALGWRWVFLLLTLPGFAISFIFWKFVPYEHKETVKEGEKTASKESVEGGRDDSTGTAIMLLSIVFAASSFSQNGITAFTTVYLVDEMSLSVGYAATLLSVLSGMAMISQPVSGWLSDFFGRKRIIAINLGLATICILALISVEDPFMAVLLLVPLGYATGSIGAVIFAYVADVTPSRALGKAYGLFYSIGRGMGGLSPVVIGFIADAIGLKNSFVILAGISLLGGLLILLVREPSNQ